MKVLVLGGTGLISGAVVRQLLARGVEVTIFHRGSTSAAHVAAGGVRELIGDRTDYPQFVKNMRVSGSWDCVIEMIGGVPTDAKSLIEAFRGRTSQLIFCSTTTVYGRPFQSVPPKEDAACLPPSPYGENKLACEHMLREAEKAGDFALTILRPAHTYGETSLVVHSLGNRTTHLDRLLQGRPIVVHNDGRGLWSSAWVEDVGAAFAAAAGCSQAFGKTYHLGGSEWFTWDDYHRALALALEAPAPKIVHVSVEELARLLPSRALQCQRTLRHPGIYDCTAARRDLGYCPQTPIKDGFARNIAYLRERNLIEPWTNDFEYEDLISRAITESNVTVA